MTNLRTHCRECGLSPCHRPVSEPRQVTLAGVVDTDPLIDGIVTVFQLKLGPFTTGKPAIRLHCHSTRAGLNRGLLTKSQPLYVTGTLSPNPRELLVDTIAASPETPLGYQPVTIERSGAFVIVHGRAINQTGHSYVHHAILGPAGDLLGTATNDLASSAVALLTSPDPGR